MKTEINNRIDEISSYVSRDYSIAIDDEDIKPKLIIGSGMFASEDFLSYIQHNNIKKYNEFKKCREDLMLSESLRMIDLQDDAYYPNNYFVETQNFRDLCILLRKLTEIETPNNKYIIGARGIGKTFTMNMALRNTFDFLSNNKIIFIRCDANKYLDLKKKEYEGRNLFSISDYINIQFINVLCEKLDHPFYRSILKELEEEDATYKRQESKLPEGELGYTTKEVKITDELKSFQRPVIDAIINHKENYAREVIMKGRVVSQTGNNRSSNNWIQLSKRIQELLKDKGYNFLKIVDGVDNVSRYTLEGDVNPDFSLLINEASDFLIRENKKSFIWIFMRNNTLAKFRQKVFEKKKENLIKDIASNKISFSFSPQDKSRIIDKRQSIFLNNYSNEFIDKSLINPSDIILQENTFTSALISSGKHIEDYISNWLSFIYAHLAYRKYPSIEFSRNYFVSNLLLNGAFFLNTKERGLLKRERGDIIFNIFYFDLDNVKAKSKWHGWCGIRVLQLISNTGRIAETQVHEILHDAFKYEMSIMIQSIKALLIYGFVRFNEEASNNNGALEIEITEAGRNVINFYFSNLDILYYCALDTPLPKTFLERKLVTAHNNDPSIKNYGENCNRTTITFLAYLCYTHRLEVENIENIEYRRYFLNPIEDGFLEYYLSKRYNSLLSPNQRKE